MANFNSNGILQNLDVNLGSGDGILYKSGNDIVLQKYDLNNVNVTVKVDKINDSATFDNGYKTDITFSKRTNGTVLQRLIYCYGTLVRSSLSSSEGDYIPLFWWSTIKEKLLLEGGPDSAFSPYRLGLTVTNCDPAQGIHFYNPEYWSEYDRFYCYFYPSYRGSVRANINLFYALVPYSAM